jgi:poly [ADP-ribose] polymerase 7/11/12/13
MFVVKVMTGEYTPGKPEYSRPPNKDNGRLYDSCVDIVSNPSIFVIFDLHQVYPEYLIKYDKP